MQAWQAGPRHRADMHERCGAGEKRGSKAAVRCIDHESPFWAVYVNQTTAVSKSAAAFSDLLNRCNIVTLG